MVSYITGGTQAKGIIFGPTRDENREWRRLHNEELHSLYRSPNIVRVKIEMDKACSQNGGK